MTAVRKTPLAVQTDGRFPIDPVLAGIAFVLLLFGFVMVGSASLEIGAKNYGDPFHLLLRHSFYIAVAGAAALLTISVPISTWQRFDVFFLVLGYVLLMLVLVPGVGKEVNGATRWIALGSFSLQGSEFVKLFVLFYIAGYLVRRSEEVANSLSGFVKPLIVLALVVLLLLGQPDFGASIVIISAAIGMIFLAGIPYRFFVPMMIACITSVAAIAVLQPYRLARLTTFTDPWEHQFGSGYQLTQALIAFGRGEWFGLGLGNSIQKLFFLPEAHTDFLFSIIAEELGVIGAGVVIVLFASLVIRGLMIGQKAIAKEEFFHGYLAFGIALILGIQAMVNLGVNLGVLPTKGLTLPFMSYGGNSLISCFVMLAVLLRIEYEVRRLPESDGGSRRKAGARVSANRKSGGQLNG